MTRMPELTGHVYVLKDARTGELRYVGQTIRSLNARLWEHRNAARHGSHVYSARWINVAGSHNVQIESLGEYSAEELSFWECFWLAALNEAGCRLTNIAPGGRTGGGFPKGHFHHTEESKRKISKAQVGRKDRSETRRKKSEAAKLRKHTPETIEKLRSREFSDEHRAKLRAAWERRRARAA